MSFASEKEFESALVDLLLSKKGWEDKVIYNPTESDLIQNWANILFENNRTIDRLNEKPLTKGEIGQIIEQIKILRTPLKLNGLINGKTITIKRDNEDDLLHFGKEVSLKIYDRKEIAAGQSRYQIVRQPQFSKKNRMLNYRRGDIMLLINGMPVIHIELKKSGIPVSQACYQIEKYSKEGVFTGLFSLIQIFVAMNPEETLYFANPGPDNSFNPDYYFKWADLDNEPIDDYKSIASKLLSIPMAHQLIGFYTVADNADGNLKVMRSYQYYAASSISDKVSKTKWHDKNQRGGFIWHTTGSGKTLTSYKSAQLIANSGDADKVVFLTDRIELGTQTLKEFKGFAEAKDAVQATENTAILISKLKSSNPSDILIVTSIQKMSNIEDGKDSIISSDIKQINKKRLVFIIDEAHRSTFGKMLLIIKTTFTNAIFFGFTGTPIFDENQKKLSTTSDIFGDELHRYSIADGIKDKNVLGFDPYKVLTFKDIDIRKVIALEKAKAISEEDVFSDEKKTEVYLHYINNVKMYGDNGEKGIEDYLHNSQYRTKEHQETVVKDICSGFSTLSRGFKYHAIFATSSIPEAIAYYKLIKKQDSNIKVTCQIDPNIDNEKGFEYKEEGLIEIIKDYNAQYKKDFTLATADKLKKDIAFRLAHKEYYKGIEKSPEEQINLLIVVEQMLTGFDSKWINTLYIDKNLEYANIIQAFSRTNRLSGPEKQFGTIKYYRKPHTMEQNIKKAVKLYSGDRPISLFAQKLQYNIKKMNNLYEDIKSLFTVSQVPNLDKLPEGESEKKQFAKLFKELNLYREAALIQGFDAESTMQYVKIDDKEEMIEVNFSETDFLVLTKRYQELSQGPYDNPQGGLDIPYDLDPYLIEIDTGKIDTDYMNSMFDKYLKLKKQDNISQELIEQALNELHKTFATLSQGDQKYAELFLHDIDKGDIEVEEGKTLRDYITDYRANAYNDKIFKFAKIFDLDEEKLRKIMNLGLNKNDINGFGRLDDIKNNINFEKAKLFFEEKEKCEVPIYEVDNKVDKILRNFILSGGFDI